MSEELQDPGNNAMDQVLLYEICC